MANRFQVLEHTADLKLRITGKTLEKLFENAAFALAVSQKGDEKFEGKEIKKEIKIESGDVNSLLVDFLNEVLYSSSTEEKVFPEVKIKEISEQKLLAEALGYNYDNLKIEIKAATYHGLEIKKEKNLYVAEIIFDI